MKTEIEIKKEILRLTESREVNCGRVYANDISAANKMRNIYNKMIEKLEWVLE